MKEIKVTGTIKYEKDGWEYVEDTEHITVVDDWRYDFLSQFTWKVHMGGPRVYAVSFDRRLLSKGKKNAMLHHFIGGWPNKGLVTEHINGDSLCNLDNNIDTVTIRQNLQNICVDMYSQLPGVTYDITKKKNKFVSRIRDGKIIKFLGGYENQVDAFFAYKEALTDLGEVFTSYTLEKCYKIIDAEMVHI